MTTFTLSSLPRTFRTLVLATLLFAGLLTVRAEAEILSQTMSGASAANWVIGDAAYLTASTGVDTSGDGWLRLTDATNDQSGYAFYDSAFGIPQEGVVIQFDYAAWGGNGADGFSVYLFDGSYNAASFSAGASGGSLGYAQKVGTGATDDPGLTGGYIGVGIDEFGNFSSPGDGRIGGPGQRPNSVAVRGPYDYTLGAYYYLGGTAANVGTLWFNQSYRPPQNGTQYRKVVIYLTPVAAPNYMQVDVFMQFGYNQPIVRLINTLYTMRPIPASVKIGYAASTGGSTNVHEIRNLIIDTQPDGTNLAIAKSASIPIVAPGGALTYTVTARNYGPNLVTIANNVPIVDTLPAQLTGANWTCVAAGTGSSCGAASGSGNLNTTATLAFNGSATYTINGTVAAATPLGTVLTNTATLSAPVGITDYNPVDNSASADTTVSNGNITISGYVYNDTNHNGIRDGAEIAVNGITYYAKLFRAGNLTATVVPPVTVSNTSGLYTFSNVPAYGDYIVILSSTNTANVYDPSFPNANWIYVAPLNYILTGVVANGGNLTNRNFFLYNGSRISGKVIKDDGFNGSISTAYDGILNAAETGIAGVTVTLRNATGLVTHDTSVTDSNGNFVLFTTLASTTLRIYENNLASTTSVSYNAGTTGGTYTIAGEYLQFAYVRYTNYNNILFGDVPTITLAFTPTPLSGSGVPSATTYYAHTFNATGRGSVVFSTVSRTQGSWPAIAYVRDLNCNGSFDVGEPDIVAAVDAEAATNICVLVREAIPAGAVNGNTDTIVTRATFTSGLLAAAQTRDVTDTTTVRFPILSTSTKSWINRNGGDPLPGNVIRYTITLLETAGVAASNVSVSDVISAPYSNFTVVSFPAGASNLSTPGTGPLSITDIALAASGSATIVFDVTIPLGTATGTVINNSATITVPAGIGGTPTAPELTVDGGSMPGTGNKPLYLYNTATSANNYTLSRTPMTTNNAASVTIQRGSTEALWTLTPALSAPVTINSGGNTIPVVLYLATNSSRTYDIPVTLRCGTNNVATVSRSIGLNATITSYIFDLPATTYTCAAGSAWALAVTNTQGGTGTGRNVLVYTARTAGPSNVALPSQSVINLDNSDVTFYSAAYPAGGVINTVTSGNPIYIRATVSDPFGAYDISGAAVTLTDSAGAIKLNDVAMTEIAALITAGTKTYQYGPYNVPTGGPGGAWSARVVATEGTEGTVSDYGIAALTVTLPLPSITVLKSANGVSKANSGQVVTYTITTSNGGPGFATAVKVIDNLSPFVSLVLDYDGVTPPDQPFDFTPASSGLTLGTPAYYNAGGVFTPNFAAGEDGTVTRWEIPMTGNFNAGSNFSINFKVRVK